MGEFIMIIVRVENKSTGEYMEIKSSLTFEQVRESIMMRCFMNGVDINRWTFTSRNSD